MRSITLTIPAIVLVVASMFPSGLSSRAEGCVFPNNPCERGSRCIFDSSPYGKCMPEVDEENEAIDLMADARPVNDILSEDNEDTERDGDAAPQPVVMAASEKVPVSSSVHDYLTACQNQRKKEAAECGNLIGCFITQCTEAGKFAPMQCHPSTGYCWCVDKAGKKVFGTDRPPGSSRPNCASERADFQEVDSAAETNSLDMNLNAESLETRRNNDEFALGDSTQITTKKVFYTDKSDSENTSPTLIFLWVVIGCAAVLLVSIPMAGVCACLRYKRRINREKSSMRTTIYPGQGARPMNLDPQARLAILQTYERLKKQQEPSDVLSEPSVVRQQTTPSQEPAQGHMDIYTGHRVLSYLDDHIEHPDRLDKEWQGLVDYEAERESKTDSREELNRAKNRYPDILPYNGNRVHLDSAVNPSRSDYINASFICDRSRQPSYIATQGPLESTVSDFWQMVWEQGCSVIVNLTELVDQGIPQCHQYWPSNGRATYHMYELDFVSSHPVSIHYTIRSFFLKNLKTEATRTVTQCHFHSWPSLSVPEDTQPLLEFRRKVKKTYSNASTPVLIHDSAGVGRTGTYILIDMVLTRLSSASVREIDIAATVEHLRDQRMQMVKTEKQFKFAFRALVDEVRAILDAMPGQRKQ